MKNALNQSLPALASNEASAAADARTADIDLFELDEPKLKEACGVVGIYGHGVQVARPAFFALYALQHRGQESAGIATCDGRRAYKHRGMGLITQVFREEDLIPLEGHLAIGHTRYSTTGSSHVRNAQPHMIETLHGPLGIAHNGNLTNARALRRKLLERGVGLRSSSDSEVLLQMLAALPPDGTTDKPKWEERIAALMEKAEGAYSLTILTSEAVFAVRDPLGFRPLCIGEVTLENGETGYIAASESCALATIGAKYLREVEPGEIVRLDKDGVHSTMGPIRPKRHAVCVFEYVYFARPDSDLEGQSIHAVRQKMGEILAQESPVEADVVIGVPDSALAAAIGYSYASGIPFTEGLSKNRYIGRTFISPGNELRKNRVRMKFNPLKASLEGKRVIVVDDSIVRGNTAGPLLEILRNSGAKEVHVRISSPPVRHPCFMGVDMPTQEELIANRKSIEEIREHIGADSLAYLSHEGMMQAVLSGLPKDGGHCSACFSGEYPVEIRPGESEEFGGIQGG